MDDGKKEEETTSKPGARAADRENIDIIVSKNMMLYKLWDR